MQALPKSVTPLIMFVRSCDGRHWKAHTKLQLFENISELTQALSKSVRPLIRFVRSCNRRHWKAHTKLQLFKSISELMQALSDLLLDCFKWHLLSNEAGSQLSSIRFVRSCNRRHWKVHTSFNFSNSSNLCLRPHEMSSLRQTASESFTEVVAHIKKQIPTFNFSKDFWAHANLLKKCHTSA